MKYIFYELDDASYQKVEQLAKELAKVIRSLFSVSCMDRVSLIKRKNQLSTEIDKIAFEQRIFGYVNEEEFQQNNIKLLKNTLIPKTKLEDVMLELMNSKGKLYIILKKAMIANKNIYIMVEEDDR